MGVDHDHAGRINLPALGELFLLPEADYYLCGPLPFMQTQAQSLQSLGVPMDRIHMEVFGTGGV